MAEIKRITLSERAIKAAVKDLERYQKALEQKAREFVKRLTEKGYEVAKATISSHVFSGDTLAGLQVVDHGGGRMALEAQSRAILFFEFGTGVTHGHGHPLAGDFGMGPGTYPGKGNWDNENGWWYPTDDPRLIVHRDKRGQGWAHTYGNKPHMPMYKASREMRREIESLAKEVFG